MSELTGLQIHIRGIVQGVGFRPFVYGLAMRKGLKGWVRNTSAGVDISVDGDRQVLEDFILALQQEAPPLARIDEIQAGWQPPNGFTRFEIIPSEGIPTAFQPISPDVSICDDCLRELLDPEDRRYLYPFINCTNCGPRFTIIKDIPYDRPKTTMAPFAMCPDCAEEYHNPLDRRFHAQPVACPKCGPQVWLERPSGQMSKRSNEAISEAQSLLAEGYILAIKGLGGFHLACDATDPEAVAELRRRKLRVDKPFALMMPDIKTVEQHCLVNDAERQLLLSRQRPIVLLERRPESTVARQVAPHQPTLGVMLPYTPLHVLLFHGDQPPLTALVMTSGNLSEEPIAYTNPDARERLSTLADAFLMHDRDIFTRCDDSVIRVARLPSSSAGQPVYPLRRSRGYAPDPISIPFDARPILATGAELKNTFCLTKGHYAFISHHIGDMENYETLRAFKEGIAHFERLFRVHPEAVAYDLHPDYLATRYALEQAEQESLPCIGVQHHHAHIAACMAEQQLPADNPVIGVAFDGTGYGGDGAIWGGEFLLADYRSFQRYASLTYVPLPGGDKAIRQPWRMAIAQLHHAGIKWSTDLPPVQFAAHNDQWSTFGEGPTQSTDPQSLPPILRILHHQLETGLNAPPTSSMGRLFDAVSALVGVRQRVNYEAQAAIELEARVNPDENGYYRFGYTSPSANGPLSNEETPSAVEVAARPTTLIDPTPAFHQIVADLRDGVDIPTIAARFHNGVARMVLEVCQQMRNAFSISQVVLSGGVWQNMVLLHKTSHLLQSAGFEVFIHHQVPTNDGGLSLGQAIIALHQLNQ